MVATEGLTAFGKVIGQVEAAKRDPTRLRLLPVVPFAAVLIFPFRLNC